MNDIIFDNIVFSIQKAGGISVVWQELLQNIMTDNRLEIKCLEYPNYESNIFRKNLKIPKEKIISSTAPLVISRYCSPKIKVNSPIIFHSSYYRIIQNALVKNITTVHDFTYELMSSGLRATIHKWQKFKAINNSEAIVCISKNTANDLINFIPSVEKKRIRIIYNGVSGDYKPLPDFQGSRRDSVLFVGMRSNYKNFKFSVEALCATKYKLIICGAPLTTDEKCFLNEKLGEDRYNYVGRVSNQQLNQLYNSVHCLAYPSSYEGFGIPILEAQRAKCPVIALNTSSIPEVMGPKSFLLNNLSVSDFRNKLEQLENDRIRTEIVEKGFDYSQKFSWKKMASEYMDLYEELSTTK